MRRISILTAAIAVAALTGCSFLKLTPDQQQSKLAADEAKVIYLLKAAGCVAQTAAGTAADLGVTSVIDDKGNAVLTKVATGASKACALTVPAAAVAAAPVVKLSS